MSRQLLSLSLNDLSGYECEPLHRQVDMETGRSQRNEDNMKLAYPIILTPYEDHSGGYVVTAPDMPGLVTGGDDLAEALDMATDAASGWVLTKLESGHHEPHATNVADIKPSGTTDIVSLISLDMDAYAKKYGKKSVRKNVTIPAWLDTFAEHNGSNYSQVLRDGLEDKYNNLQTSQSNQ
jgi:predicted RNase H-like HicB family nuclease